MHIARADDTEVKRVRTQPRAKYHSLTVRITHKASRREVVVRIVILEARVRILRRLVLIRLRAAGNLKDFRERLIARPARCIGLIEVASLAVVQREGKAMASGRVIGNHQ